MVLCSTFGGAPFLFGWCSGYNIETITIVCVMFGERHASGALKNLFPDFWNRVAHTL